VDQKRGSGTAALVNPAQQGIAGARQSPVPPGKDRLDSLYTAVAEVRGGRDGEARLLDRPGTLEMSSPQALGGAGTGFNPEQLFAVAFGACFASALDLEARQSGIMLPQLAVTSSVSLAHDDDGYFKLSILLKVHLPGIDRALANRLLAAAHHACPYSRMTRGHVDVELVLDAPD
jgi:Ohr subfamily peroxiredoxin